MENEHLLIFHVRLCDSRGRDVASLSLPPLITCSLHAGANADSTDAQQRAIVYCIMHFTPQAQICKLISLKLNNSYLHFNYGHLLCSCDILCRDTHLISVALLTKGFSAMARKEPLRIGAFWMQARNILFFFFFLHLIVDSFKCRH